MSDPKHMTSVDREPQRLHAALTAAGDVAYDWDLVTDAITWHGSVAIMLGIADAGVIASGRALAGRLNPDDLLLRQQRLNAHWTGRAAFDCEYRIRAENGGFAWVHDRGTAVFDEAGRPVRMHGVWRLINSRKAHELKVEQAANYDELTGHFNKRRLREALDHIVSSSVRSGSAGAYLAVGIDKLAAINDALGYEPADAVIVAIGQRLDRSLRVSDVIGRVGGDRFGIVLANCPEEHVAIAAEKILAAVSHVPIMTASGPVYATVSIGSATFPEQAKTSYEVMTRAEAALAEAKRAGCNCFGPYRLSEEQRRQHRLGMALGERVQRALREERLVFAYQPVVVADTGAVDYYECLLRMIDEDGNNVPAGDFMPIIEQLGFIRTIDRYVLERAVAEVAANPGVCLGFNISGLTATDYAWLRAITTLLRGKRDIARRIVIEITETAALHDIEESARFVGALRELGCRIALDDFGAGFTSLRHLQTLAVDTIKIDGSFIRNLGQNYDNQVFLRHLVGLANGLGLATIAECVETAREAAILRREGVGFLQGYFIGKPAIEQPWAKTAQAGTRREAAAS
ncbi:MAG TPA: GGDEF and EAL domain-containing protein [Stellaceae bacterium]|nr:GGDEF and EAL domain-containing protein [Stellaceae bacterium]